MNVRKQFRNTYFFHLSDIFFFVCGILMLCSEIWKQVTLTFAVGGGTYDWWYFPFQLCSIPMYMLLVYPWLKSRKIRQTLLMFFMCYSLLGGIAAFADTTGLHYPLEALTIHSYIWHILLILLGLSSGAVYIRRLCTARKKTLFSSALAAAFPLLPFLYSTLFYLACCLTAVLLNLFLDRYGTINMFYINPDYQMQQIVFRDLVPFVGNSGAILLYIGSTVLGAAILFLLWRLLFRLRIRSRHFRRL